MPAPHVPLSIIPSPPINGFYVGPLFVHFYGLMYVVGITLAIIITRRRVRAFGADPALVTEIATWAVPAGIIGGRIYFDITTPAKIPHHWYGIFAVWDGGLGIWGGVAAGALVGAWRLRRHGVSVPLFMDAVAPALLVAQAIGRIGNYFNQELFGKPTSMPWGLVISYANRPPGYKAYSTFQPTFLYELIFDLALAALLVWLGHHRRIAAPGLFALYVAGYSGFRIFEELLRIDYSQYILGMRLNFFIATAMTIIGLAWFAVIQRKAIRAGTLPPLRGSAAAPAASAGPDDPPAPAGDEKDDRPGPEPAQGEQASLADSPGTRSKQVPAAGGAAD